VTEYRALLADLERRLARLDAERAEMNTAITAIKRIMGMEGQPVLLSAAAVDSRSRYAGKTVLDAAKMLIRSEGRGMRAGEIAKLLRLAGYKNNSKVFANTVYRTLDDARDKERGIVKVDGLWMTTDLAKKGAA
jgi:hypothetical protein